MGSLPIRFTELHAQRASDSDSKEFVPTSVRTPEVQQYVPNYAKYMDTQKFMSFATFMDKQSAPEKASDCKNTTELDAWYKKQKAVIKEYVPKAYANFPIKKLEKTTKRMLHGFMPRLT